jgi:hypothetical protein
VLAKCYEMMREHVTPVLRELGSGRIGELIPVYTRDTWWRSGAARNTARGVPAKRIMPFRAFEAAARSSLGV